MLNRSTHWGTCCQDLADNLPAVVGGRDFGEPDQLPQSRIDGDLTG